MKILFSRLDIDVVVTVRVQGFGALWLVDLIDSYVDVAGMIDAVIKRRPDQFRAEGAGIFSISYIEQQTISFLMGIYSHRRLIICGD